MVIVSTLSSGHHFVQLIFVVLYVNASALQNILWNGAEQLCGNSVMKGKLSNVMDLLNLLKALC